MLSRPLVTLVLALAQMSIVFAQQLPPVVLVHGFVSAQMFAKTDLIPEFQVFMNRDMYRDVAGRDRWNKAMGMVFDATTSTSANTAGWQVYTKPGLSYIEYSSANQQDPYMAKLVTYILGLNTFYKKDESLVSVNYDWRLGASENANFHKDMKAKIEQLYTTYNRPVAVIGHSMGVAMSLSFFSKQTDEWKAKYIHGFLNTAGVLAGNANFLRLILSGYDFGTPTTLTSTNFADGFVNSAVAYLMPNPTVYTENDELANDGAVSYTTKNIDAYFDKINRPIFKSMYKAQQTERALLLNQPSGIARLYCVYGIGVDTLAKFKFSPTASPLGSDVIVTNGPGDGAVPLRSLEICDKWTNVRLTKLTGVGHFAILEHQSYFEQVAKMLNAGPRMEASLLCLAIVMCLHLIAFLR